MADRDFEDRVIQSLPCSCGHDHDCATVNCSHVIRRPPVSGEPSTEAGRTLDDAPRLMNRNERRAAILAIEAEARATAPNWTDQQEADAYARGWAEARATPPSLDVERVLREAFPVKRFGDGEPVSGYPDWDKRMVTLREVIDALTSKEER